MRQTTSLAGVVLLALVHFIGAGAPIFNLPDRLAVTTSAARALDRRVHTIGGLWCAVANNGAVGSGHEMSAPFAPDTTSLIPASFEFPAGSSREHLFKGGLWVGGLVGNDTLVSAAVRANSHVSEDFAGDRRIDIMYDSVKGQQILSATYWDTNFAHQWAPRPGDPGMVGVEVRQTSRSFESPPYDRFVLVDYLIRNVRKESLRNVHVGFFADPDIFNVLRTNQYESGSADDVSGFLPDNSIAYTFDYDGDWSTNRTDDKDHNWCPSGFGMAPVYIDPAPHDTCFNWWATNWSRIDWGPGRVGLQDTTSLPLTPAEQYRVLANGEMDFDQLTTSSRWTDPHWKPAPYDRSTASTIADGSDTRWVLSFAFGDLAPNDSLRIVMALLVGDSIIQVPRYWDPETEADSFYNTLSFSDLRNNLRLARWAWASKFELCGAAPTRIRVIPRGDSTIGCTWNPAPYHAVSGYRAYRRVAGDSSWTRIGEFPSNLRLFTDHGLKPRERYEYAISSIDWNRQEGSRSRPVRVTMGRPVAPPQISVTNTPNQIRVDWTIPSQGSAFSDYSLLKLYRRAEDSSDYTLYRAIPITTRPVGSDARSAAVPTRRDPFSMTPSYLIDDSITLGVMYHYRAALTNDLGLEGPFSNSDSAMPMSLDLRGLILLTTQPSLCNLDTLRRFYGTWAEVEGFDTLTPVAVGIRDPSGPPRITFDFTVAALSRYRCLVWVNESPGDGNMISPGFYANIERYLTNGGRILLITRNHGIRSSSGDTIAIPIVEKYLGVRRTRVERTVDFVFTGPTVAAVARLYFQSAQPVSERYTAVYGDSALGWSVLGIPRDRLVDTSLLAGYTPSVGSLDSLSPDTEVLYRYQSAYPASRHHDQPIAVKRITDSTAAVLFNFPLSLMKHEQAWQALTQAVADLGIDTVNYWSPPPTTTRSLIEWLYCRSSAAPDPARDVNHDGTIDIRDVVEELNR